jgi:hypothetical protein
MSADAWRVCPKCKVKHDKAKAEAAEAAKQAYGKVTVAEFDVLRKRAECFPNQLQKFTEYYEIYMDKDGTFNIRYDGECEECGFRFEFKHQEKVSLDEKQAGGTSHE